MPHLAAGLVARISENLDAECKVISAQILQAPKLALKLAKRTIDRGVELDPQAALRVELEAIEEQLAAGEWMG